MNTIRLLLVILISTTATIRCFAKIDSEFIKNNDKQMINAAIEHPNGKAHFFVGKYFHVYNTKTGKLEHMALIGTHGWYGVPANVDAALVHPQNKKGYIFKGNMYYRYDFSKKKVDKKGILNVDGWKGLIGPIDAAIMHPTNNSAYFFKGNKYHRFNFSKNKVDKIGTIGVDGWKGIPINLVAAIMHRNGKGYAFKDDYYHRYNFSTKKVDKKAVIGRDGWKLFHQLDAVVYNDFDNNHDTVEFHYLRDQYGYYEGNETGGGILIGMIGTPTSALDPENIITKKRFGRDWYKGSPPNVDAGLYHPIENRYYFFKVEKYYRYDPRTKKIDETGVIGKDAWPGIPINLDAAYYGHDTNEVFFFRDTKVFVFDVKKKKRTFYGEISTRFNGVPNFIDAACTKDGKLVYFFKRTRAYSTYEGKKGENYSLSGGFFK